MNEKRPESSSDIVDRALEELRSPLDTPALPPELLSALLQAAKEKKVVMQRTAEAFAQTDTTGSRSVTQSLSTWRWIMRSPVSRAAATAVFVIAIGGVALWFQGGGASPALASFLAQILDAKTVRFTVISETTGQPTVRAVVMAIAPNLSRAESEAAGSLKTVIVSDSQNGRMLILWPSQKRAIITTITKGPKETGVEDDLAYIRSLLLDARDKPGLKREPLGEKQIDGRRAIGFRLSGPALIWPAGTEMVIWGDPGTGLPIRVEISNSSTKNKVTASGFAFNVVLDKSLFSVEPPPGYTVETIEVETIEVKGPFPPVKPAFATLIRPILEAKTVKFKSSTERAGKMLEGSGEWSIDIASNRSHGEIHTEKMYYPLDRSVIIEDGSDGKTLKSLMYWPAAKLATIGTTVGMPAKRNWFQEVRSVLLDARDKPDVKVEPLGEKKIEGRQAVGYRVTDRLRMPGTVVEIWGDPLTGLPIRIETTDRLHPDVKSISSNFVFNVRLDESLFNLEPPPGYKVNHLQFNISVGNEKDLVQSLRFFSEVGGDAFPDDFGPQANELLQNSGIFLKPGKGVAAEVSRWMKIQHWTTGLKLTNEQKQKVASFREQAVSDHVSQCHRALRFVVGLPPQADAHYAGKGVKFGAADTPIFWYRPKDAKKYRVIYADLSIRDANAPPKVRNAQSLPKAASPKK
jgi:outer membrane lipoprotein-sorting protein